MHSSPPSRSPIAAPHCPPSSHPDGWTFHILTFGCKVNQYESQALREAWKALGGTESPCADTADVALVNSCAITARGERDARNALYRLQRAAPTARRILTGCSACLASKDLHRPCVGVVVPPRAKALLLQGPWQWQNISDQSPLILPHNTVHPAFGPTGFSIRAFARARPVLKVQDGCSHRCTYCIVPLTRGPSVSRSAQDILAEARLLLQAGHGEIMISGINLHHYGRDIGTEHKDFWSLLRWLDKELATEWAGAARLRISSLEPTQLDNRGLDVLASCRMLCHHAHLSLQNGSERVLRRMGRGHYRLPRLEEALRQLRQIWPDMGLGADILMGFPGEEEVDVQDTLDAVRLLHLSYAHVFPYSVRPGTPAATFAGQVPQAHKAERAARVRHLVEEQKLVFLKERAEQEALILALDRAEESNSPEGHAGCDKEQQHSAQPLLKGVEESYAPCRLLLHEGQQVPNVGLVRVRPIGVEEGFVVVRL